MLKGQSYTYHPQLRSIVRGLIGWYLNLLTFFYQHLIIVGVFWHTGLNGQNIVGGADDMWEGGEREENDALSMAVKGAE